MIKKGLNKGINIKDKNREIGDARIVLSEKSIKWGFILVVVFLVLSSVILYFSLRNIGNKMDFLRQEISGQINNAQFSAVIGNISESVFRVVTTPYRETRGMAYYVNSAGGIMGSGTSFAIHKDGYLLTAYHVIDGAESIYLITQEQPEENVKAIVYATKPEWDLAILKVEKELHPVELGNFEQIIIGSKIGFVGFSFATPLKITSQGIVSSQVIGYKYVGDTDAPVFAISGFVNEGNSGSPVFLADTGKVIGIINQRQNNPTIPFIVGDGILDKATVDDKPLSPEAKVVMGITFDLYNQLASLMSKSSQVGIGISTSLDSQILQAAGLKNF